jgi:hypothetical protein
MIHAPRFPARPGIFCLSLAMPADAALDIRYTFEYSGTAREFVYHGFEAWIRYRAGLMPFLIRKHRCNLPNRICLFAKKLI